ncbi:amidohydrolase family protein [Sphingomonas nostoxanthinifaciens]|uniref:amidohydrolase family protein n=1 Tax=Sphingomonas nostoxanthinifaciens TaxID=2872652 RepID=UPI001CC1C812|nr:amidohydrolase family protein [Sphingomonas nostoxanthinifaciens]UAK22897.1 amidohydrolase family protein [Sphingomonas nostoxanthinifaciens]
MVRLLAAGVALAAICAPVAAQPVAPATEPYRPTHPIAIVGGQLLDGNGGAPLTGQTVLIEGEKIVAVGPSASMHIPADAERIDATGMTVMPGLINSNQHIQLNPIFPAPAANLPLDQIRARWEANFADMPKKAYVYLMQGVTTMRQTSGPFKRLVPIKHQIDAGEIPGPRIMLGGALIMSPQFFNAYIKEAKTPPDAVEWMRNDFAYYVLDDIDKDTEILKGGDFAYWKLYLADEEYDGKNDFSDDQLHFIIAKAHRNGKKIDVHAHASNEGLRRILKFDIDTLEHPFYGNFRIDPDIAETAARKNILSTTLLRVMVTGADFAEDPNKLDETNYIMSMTPEQYRVALDYRDKMLANKASPDSKGFPMYDRRARHADMGVLPPLEKNGPSYTSQLAARDTSYANMRLFVSKGAKLTMGTDTPSFLNFQQEDPNAREMMDLEKIGGMTPMQVIVTSTRNGAQALGMLDTLGTVEKGKLADVIVVAGDPLKDMGAMKRVAYVIKGGVRFK